MLQTIKTIELNIICNYYIIFRFSSMIKTKTRPPGIPVQEFLGIRRSQNSRGNFREFLWIDIFALANTVIQGVLLRIVYRESGRFATMTFRPQDVSYSRRFAPKTFRHLDVSPSRRFVLETFRTQDVSAPRHFASSTFSLWTFRPLPGRLTPSLDVSPPLSRFGVLDVIS